MPLKYNVFDYDCGLALNGYAPKPAQKKKNEKNNRIVNNF